MGVFLVAWSGAACIWWLVSAFAVRTFRARAPVAGPSATGGKSLVLFKPLPPGLPPREREQIVRALDSFAAQLRPEDCMLVGIPESESWDEVKAGLEKRHPHKQFQWIVRPSRQVQWPNPKVDGLACLAGYASRENVLWLWSDVDIVAGPDFLSRLLADWDSAPAALVTCPFVIRQVTQPWHLLDALFVAADFFPGVCLFGGRRTVRFALGSAMLFRPEDFFSRGGWEKIGRMLADDFALGNLLQPARLGSAVLETHSSAESWSKAVEHVYRWQKTIRWCRPFGFAGQIVMFPILGWFAAVFFWGGGLNLLLGILVLLFCESVRSAIQLRLCGCAVRPSQWIYLPFCAIVRAVCWLACWLPFPVSWRDKFWAEPESEPALPAGAKK